MDQAAAQAAEGTSATAAAQLEVLRQKWGAFCSVGNDAERGWWASRHGQVGHIITADGPGELDRLVADDFGPGW